MVWTNAKLFDHVNLILKSFEPTVQDQCDTLDKITIRFFSKFVFAFDIVATIIILIAIIIQSGLLSECEVQTAKMISLLSFRSLWTKHKCKTA